MPLSIEIHMRLRFLLKLIQLLLASLSFLLLVLI